MLLFSASRALVLSFYFFICKIFFLILRTHRSTHTETTHWPFGAGGWGSGLIDKCDICETLFSVKGT